MALKDIQKTIGAFLTSPEPAVLALSGDWGTGKTFLWHQLIDHYSYDNPIAPIARRRRAYISAAGCENLNDLKTAILAQTEADKFKKFIPDATISGISVGQIIKSGLGTLAQLKTKNALICIDDIERADKINPYDILHYAAWLRDERNCKVALLLNQNQIDPKHQEKFKRALEKGCDQFLNLNLTAEEAGDTWKKMILERKKSLSQNNKEKVFPEGWIEPFLAITTKLGIHNIRVLDHLANALKRWYPLIKKYENSIAYKELRTQIFLGTIITGWGRFEPDFCVSWKEIAEHFFPDHPIDNIDRGKGETPKQENFVSDLEPERQNSFKKIKKLIEENFGYSSETPPTFFPTCFSNIEDGYLPDDTEKKIQNFIDNTEKRHEAERIKKLYTTPYELMFLTAGDTSDELKAALKEVANKNPVNIDLKTAGQFVEFSKVLGEKEQADKFIQKWTNSLEEMPDTFFNIPNVSGDDRVSDDTFDRTDYTFYLIDKRLLEPWKIEKAKRPNTFENKEKFIQEAVNGTVFSQPRNVLLTKDEWMHILRTHPVFNYNNYNGYDYCNILRVISYKQDSTGEKNFINLREAIQELLKNPLYKYRFQITLRRDHPDILEAYGIPQKTD